MGVQLWVTAVVAVLGYGATLLGIWLGGWRAHKLTMFQRTMDRADARANAREGYFRDFLGAARLLRLSTDAESGRAALAEVRRAAAGIELYASPPVRDLLPQALASVERLARVRAEGAWSDMVDEAETECDHAVAALRDTMRTTLDVKDDPPSLAAPNNRP